MICGQEAMRRPSLFPEQLTLHVPATTLVLDDS